MARNPQNFWIGPASRSGGNPCVPRSDSTTPARKVASARTRATRWGPFPSASGPRREECVGEGETGRSRLRPCRHPGPERQRRDARLDRGRSARKPSGEPSPRRSSEAIEVETELLGDLWPGGPVHLDGRGGGKSMVSPSRHRGGRTSASPAAGSTSGGRRGCARPHGGSSALWSLSRLGLGGRHRRARRKPGCPSPTATTGARSPPWRSRREAGPRRDWPESRSTPGRRR